MRLTTANNKSVNYTENHEIFVGTHTGSFKRINVAAENPHSQINLQSIDQLTKESRITVLEYGDDINNEILLGRMDKSVQVYDITADDFSSNVELPDVPIVGLAKYGGKIIAGLGSGNIHIVNNSDPVVLSAGDHMSKMRQCKTARNLVATGGKERKNNLKIFDLESMKQTFSSKNLPNDFLQLEVPVWDCDLGFIDANTISTCSRYGYVRLYDTRVQRRPIQTFATEDQMSFSCLIAQDNRVYVGTTMGALKAFDTRKFKNFLHTYKGFTGSLSDLVLDNSGQYLVSASLDRYVRVHHAESCAMMYQCYVKSKATQILIRNGDPPADVKEESSSVIDLVEGEAKAEGSDDEYNDLFNHMQTVSETNAETGEPEVKRKKKRKLLNNDKIVKKTKKSE